MTSFWSFFICINQMNYINYIDIIHLSIEREVFFNRPRARKNLMYSNYVTRISFICVNYCDNSAVTTLQDIGN